MDHLSDKTNVLSSSFGSVPVAALAYRWGTAWRAPRQPWTVPSNCSSAQARPHCTNHLQYVSWWSGLYNTWLLSIQMSLFLRSGPKTRHGWDGKRKRQGKRAASVFLWLLLLLRELVLSRKSLSRCLLKNTCQCPLTSESPQSRPTQQT